ncbi:hypothetical protein J2Z49_000452 [Desulfofundulus luciae]|uniref:Uncharacterized protein n=1 Tax=Desulfofundulus luciae TaxID=74702 RepID=A0ABU0AXZ9_9FIRM|nr:hypothetical protein [Desulfofundulus luciae]
MCLIRHTGIHGKGRGESIAGGEALYPGFRVLCRGTGRGWRWRMGMGVRGP